jgi:tyrosyl-tRNA synthetase
MKTNDFKTLKTRAVEEIIGEQDLDKLLRSSKKLRIKHGIDPTSSDIHLGYTVIYHKLKEFQELGHKIVFLIGDFTARFGDPTDKSKTRTMRDRKDVIKASKNYLAQIGKILD